MPEVPDGKKQLATAIDAEAFDTLKRLAKTEDISLGDLIARLVLAYDAESGGSGVIQIQLPRTRDGLADALTELRLQTQDWIGERDQISALGVARARAYKTTAEYQDARKTQPFSIYEDEVALANDLSNGRHSLRRNSGEPMPKPKDQ
jgi:hypothetical protein